MSSISEKGRLRMKAERILLSIIVVCGVLLMLDLFVYSTYHGGPVKLAQMLSDEHDRAHRSVKRTRKRWSRHKVENWTIEVERSRTFPINRTDLLSEQPQCRPNKSRNRLWNFFGPIDMSEIPLFVDKHFMKNDKLIHFAQPFGFKEVEGPVMHVLKLLPYSSLPKELKKKSCLRCVVVGNGGIMRNSRLGDVIDNFDIIIRMNDAPVFHFEKDVGSRTTIRLAYPESTFRQKENFSPDWQLAIIAYKPLDLVWLHTVLRGKTMKTNEGFWKRIALAVHKKPDEIRLVSPEVLQIGSELIGNMVAEDTKNKHVPTTGFIAITMALKMCDEVAVVGFGYDISKPKSHLHYYDGLTMDIMKRSGTHDVSQETKTLVKLVEQGIIHDITGGIKVVEKQQNLHQNVERYQQGTGEVMHEDQSDPT